MIGLVPMIIKKLILQALMKEVVSKASELSVTFVGRDMLYDLSEVRDVKVQVYKPN